MRLPPSVVRLCALALIAAVLAGCGLGEKQEQADRIIGAVERTVARGAATGTLQIENELVSTPEGINLPGLTPPDSDGADDDAPAPDDETDPSQVFPPAAGAPAAASPFGPQNLPPIVVDIDMDLTGRRAQSSYRTVPEPFAVFDALDLYAKRFNAGERDARPWVFLPGEDLKEGSGGLTGIDSVPFYAGFALNPIVLLDLAAAPLTGSVELVGIETVAGVETTRYSANFDIEKMLTDTREKQFTEDQQEQFEILLELLVVAGKTHPGDVWLDDDDLVRRFAVRLRQEPINDLKFDLTVQIELDEIGRPVVVAPPTVRELVKVSSVIQFLNAGVPAPGSSEFLQRVVGMTDV